MISINGIIVDKSTFGAGEYKLDKLLSDDDFTMIFYPIVVRLKFEDNGELFMLKLIKDHLDSKYNKSMNLDINLEMEYIPYSRMDRVQDENDVFTLKYFAKFINDLKFSNVYVLDPHSNVASALLDNVVEIDMSDIFKNLIDNISSKNLMIVFPDYSAYKKYRKFFKDYKMMYCEKTRNWDNHKIENTRLISSTYNIGESDKMDILIVDDILSYGGTLYNCTDILRNQYPNNINNIYTYTTHTENVVAQGKFYKECLSAGIVKTHFTTDSLLNIELPGIVKLK